MSDQFLINEITLRAHDLISLCRGAQKLSDHNVTTASLEDFVGYVQDGINDALEPCGRILEVEYPTPEQEADRKSQEAHNATLKHPGA